jgi:enoyl-CoA hydratase/carnithine racemase/acyl dehydratase
VAVTTGQQAMREVLVERRGAVTVVTLNRPEKLNAMTTTMAREYADALRAADADPDVRVVVVTGAGRGFCAGADLSVLEQGADSIRDFVPAKEDLPVLALRLSKPVIAAVNGAVAGVGFAYMLGSDIRYAARDASIGTTFSRLGLVAEYGVSWLLPRVVGVPEALDLLLDGGPISGEEAARIGLVHESVEPDRVLDRALEHADRLAAGTAPYSLAQVKAQVYADQFRSLDDALDDALRRMDASFDRPDLAEAIAARAERRAPLFRSLGGPEPVTGGDPAGAPAQPVTPRSVGLDEVESLVGEALGPTAWTTVAQWQVDRFAETTYDDQWIHVDVQRAKEGPFGTTIAHGYLTLSLVPLFLGQLLEVRGTSMAMNYGLEKVRFPAPVPVGSRLRATGEVVAVRPKGGTSQVTVRVSVECEQVEKPVCVADVVILYIA